MGFAEYAIRNRLIMWIVVAIAVLGGAGAYNNMPRFEDPEFLIRTAQIYTQYPGATPLEVADEVTDTIETELQTMQEVEEIRSTSADGISIIEVDIKHQFSANASELQLVWTKLRARVDDAAASLPPGVETPVIYDDFGDVFGLYYLVSGRGYSLVELEDYAKALRTDLLAVDGVAKVDIAGARTEAIYVEIARDRAAALGVSVNSIFADLSAQNSVVAAGDVPIGTQRVIIQPTGSLTSVEAIENLVVSGNAQGDLVYLRDIANVRRGYVDPPRSLVRYNGEAALAIGISNVTGANVGRLGEDIRDKLAETLGERPIGVQVSEFYHQGDAVNAAVQNFAVSVGLALLIVLVTLFIFMGLRSAIIIGAVLLVTIAATIVTMNMVDIPLHRISLGALIIALGMLVDNAIVITDGILVGVQAGRRKLDIASEIVGKTKWALLGGTIVGIIAFAPIGLSEGNTGEYTGHLFWVILISLLYSWIFALTLVPMFADILFKERPADADAPKAQTGPILGTYKAFMRIVLAGRWITLGLAVGVFMAAIWGFQFVKSGFFPSATTIQIGLDYWLPEGTDIAATETDALAIEQHLGDLEGVTGVQTLIGTGALRYMLIYAPETPNAAYAQFLIKVDKFDRIAPLMPQIQAYIDDNYPSAQGRVWRFTLGPGQGSKIEATFQGPDPAQLRRLSAQARAIMLQEPGATGVKVDWRQEVPVTQLGYGAERGRRVGVSREDLANALETNFSGSTVGIYREGDDLIPIIARAPESERLDLATGSSIQIPSSRSGGAVPVSEVVNQPQMIWRDGRIRRENRVWTIKVQSDPVPGLLASDLLNRLRPQIEAIDLPEGYALRWDGEFGNSTEANQQLAQTLPFGIGAMVLVVVLLFNALRQPLVIWLIVPLAVVGVVIGLVATGTTLEFMAILGILSLSGLLIKNAIVLVDQMDLEIREGKPRFDAVLDSAASRVRPVMMGSLTTVLGVLPLLGDVFFASMAVVIAFGLSFATLITLIVLPALYAVMFGIKANESAANETAAEA